MAAPAGFAGRDHDLVACPPGVNAQSSAEAPRSMANQLQTVWGTRKSCQENTALLLADQTSYAPRSTVRRGRGAVDAKPPNRASEGTRTEPALRPRGRASSGLAEPCELLFYARLQSGTKTWVRPAPPAPIGQPRFCSTGTAGEGRPVGLRCFSSGGMIPLACWLHGPRAVPIFARPGSPHASSSFPHAFRQLPGRSIPRPLRRFCL